MIPALFLEKEMRVGSHELSSVIHPVARPIVGIGLQRSVGDTREYGAFRGVAGRSVLFNLSQQLDCLAFAWGS